MYGVDRGGTRASGPTESTQRCVLTPPRLSDHLEIGTSHMHHTTPPTHTVLHARYRVELLVPVEKFTVKMSMMGIELASRTTVLLG